MINVHQWAEIRRLHLSEGLGIKAIARRLGLARNTVRAALRSGEPPAYRRPSIPSKLDPFRAEILSLLDEDAEIPGKRVLEILSDQGYRGGKSILNEHLREVRPLFRRARTYQRRLRPRTLLTVGPLPPGVEAPEIEAPDGPARVNTRREAPH